MKLHQLILPHELHQHAPILGQVDALDLPMYFCLNKGEIHRNQGYLLDFKCRKDQALIIHDNCQNGPFQTRDISKRLKHASTSPGLPF